jgi:hypothetical protein
MRVLTQPVLGQYPRPWMSDLNDPSDAEVLLSVRTKRLNIKLMRLELMIVSWTRCLIAVPRHVGAFMMKLEDDPRKRDHMPTGLWKCFMWLGPGKWSKPMPYAFQHRKLLI